ncbi:hypothetical protein HNR46_001721 [Haloferula luteola]|uniref:Cytochrome c-552/4 domain-containing protein n=1 Tax=Haloferula luteola TaxID=595692 RepID=A0A840V7C4_9BACT|nr:multiheme c-type cytochrome [Haloferula luteola]MBB5351484.1 hypothetical protein [Haloferula luteola]
MRLLSILLLGCLLASCRREPAARVPLAIHFTCDTIGRLEPCGCFTGQHGGLTRLRTWLQERDREGASLRLDVGGALAGHHDYQLLQYPYLLKAFGAMGYQALNLGGREATVDASSLRQLVAHSPVPVISASIVDSATREPLFSPYTLIDWQGRKIAILGLLDPHSVPQLGEGLAILDLPEAVDRILPELREKSDLIIALAFTPEAGLERLARSYFEFDIILGGDVGQPAPSLQKINDSLVAFTANEGRTVATLSAWIPPGENPRLEDSAYHPQLLLDQIPQDPEFHQWVVDYRAEIAAADLAVDHPEQLIAAGAIPGVTASATYVGSAACQTCHQDDHALWASSQHAHAFDTLMERGAAADPNCIPCHTVGFGEPSGYRRSDANSRLTGVGCESCHGPGSTHVAERTSGRPPRFRFRPLGAADCTTCHHGEFSRPFDWETFWPPVRHGSPGP